VYFPVGCRLVVLSGDRNITIEPGQSLFAVLASAGELNSSNALHVSGGSGVDCLLGSVCLGCVNCGS